MPNDCFTRAHFFYIMFLVFRDPPRTTQPVTLPHYQVHGGQVSIFIQAESIHLSDWCKKSMHACYISESAYDGHCTHSSGETHTRLNRPGAFTTCPKPPPAPLQRHQNGRAHRTNAGHTKTVVVYLAERVDCLL